MIGSLCPCVLIDYKGGRGAGENGTGGKGTTKGRGAGWERGERVIGRGGGVANQLLVSS